MQTNNCTIVLSGLLVAACLVTGMVRPDLAQASGAANDHTVLILDGTVSGGAGSLEALAAIAAGMDVEVVSDATWAAKTAAEFATYRAVVLGDPTCVYGISASLATATANNLTWGPTVNGKVIIIGTDPVFHSFIPGARTLINKAMAFAVSDVGKTGAFLGLSCYYDGAAPSTPVPVLDGLGAGPFTVIPTACFNTVHITATSPATSGLTDADLSGWSCSIHEAFDSFPASFDVLAMGLGLGATYTAADGSVGTPYILARGATITSDICMSPDSATNVIGQPHTICAFVNDSLDCSGAGLPGVAVCFNVLAGPCSSLGSLGCVVTDSTGTACITYTCHSVGTDVIEASYTDAGGRRHFQKVTKNWITSPNRDPDCSLAVASEPVLWPPNHKYHAISILGVSDPDSGDVVTITVTGVTQDEPTNTRGDGNTCPDAQISGSQASVRAERTGTPGIPGNGRVYTIHFTADDGNGGSCNGSVTVCVPHDQGDPTCVDDGQRYDSTGPCGSGGVLGPEAVSLRVGSVSGNAAQISFALPAETFVDISVFDVSGRRLATLEKGVLTSGVYDRTWNMGGVSNGLYFVRLKAGDATLTKTVLRIQ